MKPPELTVKPPELIAYYCAHCGKLLGRFRGPVDGEIKCPRCGRVNDVLDEARRPVLTRPPRLAAP